MSSVLLLRSCSEWNGRPMYGMQVSGGVATPAPGASQAESHHAKGLYQMISALAWVPRGVAKAVPAVAQPTEEELAATREELTARGDGEPDGDEEENASGSDVEPDGEEQAIAHAKAAAAAITSTRKAAGGSKSAATSGIEEAMKELDMDHYDDSDDDDLMTRCAHAPASNRG